MNREIFLVGLNHRTAGVDVRERFALTADDAAGSWPLPCRDAVNEALILSTCNRVELLASGCGDVASQMLAEWARACGARVDELNPYVYVLKNAEAVRHLFSVASSLDSMVVGEPQVLGQLKAAYRQAARRKATGAILNRLLHKAFSVAKRVRTETGVASSAVSISYAAVELAKRIFGDMREHTALLIGAGEMAELAATHLVQAGIARIFVANRTYARAQALAEQFRGQAVPFEQLPGRHLADADIVITSTGSPTPLIHARDVRSILKSRGNRPVFFIDIAVPRDIDPDVNGLDNVYLYDIDDLKEIVEENISSRREEAVKAAEIIDAEVENFLRWLESLEVQPAIVSLVRRGEQAAREEVAKTLKHFDTLDEKGREALEKMARAVARKLNHAPIMYLKRSCRASGDATQRIATVMDIFNLDGKAEPDGEEN